jgi:uncharacterized protein YndB with AHSA1/START domain
VQAEGTLVTREVRIDASPETVFAFLTDPELMVRWKGSSAVLDPVPGGIYRVDVAPGNVAVGEYVEIDPPNRLVITWGWEGDQAVPPGSSLVEIVLVPERGGTLLRLTHSKLPRGAETVQGEGWDHFLPRLAVAAAGGDPGPDRPAMLGEAEEHQAPLSVV